MKPFDIEMPKQGKMIRKISLLHEVITQLAFELSAIKHESISTIIEKARDRALKMMPDDDEGME